MTVCLKESSRLMPAWTPIRNREEWPRVCPACGQPSVDARHDWESRAPYGGDALPVRILVTLYCWECDWSWDEAVVYVREQG